MGENGAEPARAHEGFFGGGGAAVAKRMRGKVDGGGKTMKGNLELAGC